MAQYIIPATFADDTWFVEGLTPTITIRQRDENNLIYKDIFSGTMEDKGLGDYIYTFIDYDKIKLYTYKIDWWSDELTSRYLTGNNEFDYYSNKQDWGSQFRWAIGWFSDWFYKELKELKKLLEEIKPKDIDFSDILCILEELKNKEYPIQNNEEIITKIYELQHKIEWKTDKMEIISTIEKNKPDLSKLDEQNKEIKQDLIKRINEQQELIKEMKEYIEMLIKRWDIEKDKDFKNLMESVKEEDMKSLKILFDADFISLISENECC